MPTIEALTERAEAVSPQTPGSAVFSRFEREPDTLVIPVVEDGRPVGLVERNAFLLKIAGAFGHAQYAHRPVLHVMDAEPAVVEAGVSIDAFCESTLLQSFDTKCIQLRTQLRLNAIISNIILVKLRLRL